MPDRENTSSPGPSLLRKLEDAASPAQLSPQTSRKSSAANIADSRIVSFLKETEVSSAYKEHNPPTMLRKQEASRRGSADETHETTSTSTNNGVSNLGCTNPKRPPLRSRLHDSEMTIVPIIDSNASSVAASQVSSPVGSPIPTSANTPIAARSRSHSHSQPQQQQQQQPQQQSPHQQSPQLHQQPQQHQQHQPHPDEHKPSVSSPLTSETSDKKKPKKQIEKKEELHILIGVTGSVATIKVGMIIHKLKQIYHKRAIIQLIVTKASTVFFDASEIPRDVKIWYDKDEWESRNGNMDNSLHISLRRWADILLVAPCSANTMAKLTCGICDNLLTALFRVWNPAVPILLAPAMNTHMYTNPTTVRHFKALKEFYPYVEILKPVEKVLVCGDIGMGGMREWTDIVQTLVVRMGVPTEEDEEDDADDEGN